MFVLVNLVIITVAHVLIEILVEVALLDMLLIMEYVNLILVLMVKITAQLVPMELLVELVLLDLVFLMEFVLV